MNALLDCAVSLKGRVMAITGGGGVLGGNMAKAMAGLGAHVAVMDIDPAKAQATARDIREAGGEALELEADVLSTEKMTEASHAVRHAWGKIDVLVNTAGGNQPGATTGSEAADDPATPTFFGLDRDAIRQVIELNYMGTFIPSQVFAKAMARQPMGTGAGGVIINIGSMAGIRPLTKVMGYSSAKAAVENLTRWMAVHLAPAGIRVNTIAPGFFLTEQNRFLLTDKETGAWTPRAQKIIAHTPMRRMGEPDDLIGALAFLASDASRFVTGVLLPVDGGFSAYAGV